MTRQEVAVARSHVEVWKAVASGIRRSRAGARGRVWFTRGAAAAIDRGWRAALRTLSRRRRTAFALSLLCGRRRDGGARRRLRRAVPAGARTLVSLRLRAVPRGAATLLRAMPVVGPVDMWINYRFEELGALALSSPVILQRPDCASDNSYSVLPYLARAGIVDASSGPMPPEGPTPARSWPGPPVANGKASRWHCRCWACVSGRSMVTRLSSRPTNWLNSSRCSTRLSMLRSRRPHWRRDWQIRSPNSSLKMGSAGPRDRAPADLPASRTAVLPPEEPEDRRGAALHLARPLKAARALPRGRLRGTCGCSATIDRRPSGPFPLRGGGKPARSTILHGSFRQRAVGSLGFPPIRCAAPQAICSSTRR